MRSCISIEWQTGATAAADDDLRCFRVKFSLLRDVEESLFRVISHHNQQQDGRAGTLLNCLNTFSFLFN
jgi:hypothetical protein